MPSSRKRSPVVPIDLTGPEAGAAAGAPNRAAARADLVSTILDTLAAEDDATRQEAARVTVRVELEVSRELWGDVCSVAGRGNRLAIAQFVHDALCRELLRRSPEPE